ncbi:MAG: hypothetical protein JNK19_04940 [Tabrizicola sp.]|nr:hypothetical protein [Tabrizicola sp.]
MHRPTLAIAAGIGLCLTPAFGQAVPEVFPEGEIVVGLDVVDFTASDVVSATVLADSYGHSVLVEFDPRLDSAVALATAGKTGLWLDLFLCGRRLFSARLGEDLTEASFRITARDAHAAEVLVEAFLHPDCVKQVS